MESDGASLDLRTDLDAARTGEAPALGRVFQWCRPYLLAIANAELDSDLRAKVGASDLVQESMMEAQQAFDRFTGQTEDELRAWLKRILKNNLVDQVRRYGQSGGRDVGQEASLDHAQGEVLRQQMDTGVASALDRMVAREKTAALGAALKRLPEEYQRAIDLRHVGGQTFPEIGLALGKSEEAARKLWFRALEQLRK